MDLLPSVELENGFFTNPNQARFFVESHGMRLASRQKKTGETDTQFLDRVDALYAADDANMESQEPMP